mmetsp:Transcript_8736/g.12834  ORF Transcript_8736/g.12834 Transcript_8736/m.12834 type:complete len:122 (+) Transcript_8736:429-794(+)
MMTQRSDNRQLSIGSNHKAIKHKQNQSSGTLIVRSLKTMPRGSAACVYDVKLGLFRVTKTKGKSISASFGVSYTTALRAHTSESIAKKTLADDESDGDKVLEIMRKTIFVGQTDRHIRTQQ